MVFTVRIKLSVLLEKLDTGVWVHNSVVRGDMVPTIPAMSLLRTNWLSSPLFQGQPLFVV